MSDLLRYNESMSVLSCLTFLFLPSEIRNVIELCVLVVAVAAVAPLLMTEPMDSVGRREPISWLLTGGIVTRDARVPSLV